MAAAKVKVADFKASGNPGDLRVIEENLRTGTWRIREEVPSDQLLHPTSELLADFHRVFALGMEVFEALDARDAQLADDYSEEDEFGLQRAF